MKKLLNKIKYKVKEWFVWTFSRRVLDAINNEDLTYDEVLAIVHEEVAKL